jgi:hypothetical protein
MNERPVIAEVCIMVATKKRGNVVLEVSPETLWAFLHMLRTGKAASSDAEAELFANIELGAYRKRLREQEEEAAKDPFKRRVRVVYGGEFSETYRPFEKGEFCFWNVEVYKGNPKSGGWKLLGLKLERWKAEELAEWVRDVLRGGDQVV